MSKQPPPAPTVSAIGPCPTIQISRTPRHWKFTQHLCTTRPPPRTEKTEESENVQTIPTRTYWGGRVVRWCWVNFQYRGVLLIWIRVGQGPTALAVGADGGCLDIFSLVYHFPFLTPSLWETARYRLKYCLKGPLSPNQPTNQPHLLQAQQALALLYPNCRTPRHWKFTQDHRTTQPPPPPEKKEMIDERKSVQTTPTRTYCKPNRPLPYSHPH